MLGGGFSGDASIFSKTGPGVSFPLTPSRFQKHISHLVAVIILLLP